MLGKLYEQTGELEKALNSYKVLNELYPNYGLARIVMSRVKALQKILPAQK